MADCPLPLNTPLVIIGYCTAAVDERVRSASLYHCRQCSIVFKPRSDRMDCAVVSVVTHDCSRKLRKLNQCELSVVYG